MSIGISEEHVELAASLRKWGASLNPTEDARGVEGAADAAFDEAYAAAAEMGLHGIALPEKVGGGDGTALDSAVALEALAHALVPGGLLGAQVAANLLGSTSIADQLAEGEARVAIGAEPTLQLSAGTLSGAVALVSDVPGATHFLLGTTADAWYLVPAAQVAATAHAGPDLTRRFGSARLDAVAEGDVELVADLESATVRRMTITMAAAEASGIARWCLETAVDYAGVREQFGRKIGSFQAIKHLCAEMLERVETITALAWDAAAVAGGEAEQWAFSTDAVAATVFDAAVSVAHDCIQILGGIGFTFEHEAHLRLRRAMALRALIGDADAAAVSLAEQAQAGVRRQVAVDFDGADTAVRPAIAAEVAEVAALDGAAQREALVRSGLLTPHWPAPWGRGASAVEQLVIDQELSAAGVARPDLKIAGWAVPTIIAHGNDAQREKFVRPSLLGDLIWCQLFSEPEAGSDLASLRTRAVNVDGGWELTGQKVWTSLAQDAHWGICLARTNPEAPQHKGITYFLVDMTSAGLDIRPLREMTGDALFNEVFLDKVFVPDEMVVGEVDGGWKLARTTLANERVAMAGHRLGASTEQAVGLLSTASLTERVKVGHAVALATVCSLLGVRTVLRSLAGQGPGSESSVSKLLGVRSRQEASDLVVQLLGGSVLVGGPETESALHEALLTRCLSIAGGTTQVLRNVAGERILGLPR
ncbi:acyl-CoA dehydrogenase family protein [Nocardioides sp. Bht2]|uniref:acyl-CoA dehydrogenase family protein n=1 Tax=Nocardioides sp. Bht2 TaxID=3392297 RepID=UPI0039B60210